MTVAVTGADGYVGANLVRALLAKGRTVRALVEDKRAPVVDLDCEMVPIDVREPEGLVFALDGCEVVYHLAAVISITGDQDGRVPAVNVDGVGNTARAALQVGAKRFVHFSSVHAFDLLDHSRPLDESSPRPGPSHPAYDRSKAAGEARLREVIAEGLDAVILNPAGVCGPVDPLPSRIGQIFRDLVRARMPIIPSGGFNWVDVRDLVATALVAEERGRTGANYVINGRYASIGELGAITSKLAGVRGPMITIPSTWLEAVGPVLSFLDQFVEGEPMFTREAMLAMRANPVFDDSRAREELGHSPRPLEETIADLVRVLQGGRLIEG